MSHSHREIRIARTSPSPAEREVRRVFAEAEPEMVGALAAVMLANAIELRVFDLLGHAAFEAPPLFAGGLDTPALREERLVDLAGTVFARNVAKLCRFAQTGEIADEWAFGWWGEAPDGVEAVQHTAAVVLQALMVRPLGPPDAYEDGWWTDPGPIDPASPTWELVATLHLARERLLSKRGRGAPPLPVSMDAAGARLPC